MTQHYNYLCKMCRRRQYSNGVCAIEERCAKAPRLNVGSGVYPKENYINFDAFVCKGKLPYEQHLQTDIIGVVQKISEYFPPAYFAEIMSVHVVEHLLLEQALQFFEDQYNLLRQNGTIVIEGPCILGVHRWYEEEKLTLRELIDMYYPHRTGTWGKDLPFDFGDYIYHRSGWTGPIVGEELEKIGFRLIHVGPGLYHQCSYRDFRVEAIKL
jgi:hypothetical protein